MISVTLNISVTNFKFAINSTRSKNEVATTCESYLTRTKPGRNGPQIEWTTDYQRTECVRDR